jgi:hypothetical protein
LEISLRRLKSVGLGEPGGGSGGLPLFTENPRRVIFSETGHVAINRTDLNEQESVGMRPDLEAKVPYRYFVEEGYAG